MEFRRVWTLNGPNYWANCPVVEILVDLGAWRDQSSEQIPGFNDRLKSWLPTLIEHRCSVGERGGFFQRLERGTYLAHILEHVALELQNLSGSHCGFGRARELDEDGVYRVAIQFEEESLVRACIDAARELLMAAVEQRPFDVEQLLLRLRELACDVRLGPSTSAIVRAAKTRGIPVRRLNSASLVQLGQGAKSRRICTAETDRTSAIAEAVAQDKDLTRILLRSAGVPVPMGEPVHSPEHAWKVAQELGLPVVLKPQFGNHGRGVMTDLRTQEQVERAYATAREESRHLMVEQFIPGVDHRVLVIGNRMIAAAVRHPACVVGDGMSTIRMLVEQVNRDPRRSDGHSTVLSYIKLDAIGLEVLAEQGYDPDTVLPAGTMALIRRNGNLSTGGTATDVTDRVHPEVAARAIEAARIVGLDIAGVDVVATDISRSLEEQRGAIVEVNAGPGLRMHLEPTEGSPRPVGDAIIEMLFAKGETGRIPTVAVTGMNGRETITRLVAHLLQATGRMVGVVNSHGTFLGKRHLFGLEGSYSSAARSLLLNPLLEAAVFAVEPEFVYREGLGFDRCDVGIVTKLGTETSLELLGLDTLEQRLRLDRCVVDVVLPSGAAVLSADDPLVVAMAKACKGSVIFFSQDAHSPVIVEHRAAGGRAVVLRDGVFILATGSEELRLLTLLDVPFVHTSPEPVQMEIILAGIAAGWSLQMPAEALRLALSLFTA